MNQEITRDFILKVPKTDLHVHLDGSMRLETLIELAKERNVTLPSYTVEGLKELVFKERYADLGEYLHGFKYLCAVLQDPESLERTAYELALDNQAEGVCYIEPRFAPQLHVNSKQSMKEVLSAVHRGLEKAKVEFNVAAAGRDEPTLDFEYGIIVCALRMFAENFSEYYRDFLRVHEFTPLKQVYSMASLELAQAAVALREAHGLPIVAFDLAGQENGYPAENHVEAYQYAHKNFINKTVHAGEAYGPESIFQAITDLHADRIGHGYHLMSLDKLVRKEGKSEYIRKLSEYIADKRITVEVCLTSNLQTNPELARLEEHAFKEMRRLRFSTTFCTDNRTVSNTTVTQEIEKAVDLFDLSRADLKHILVYGFKRSFFPGTYLEKRKYVRRVIDYYQQVEERMINSGG